MSTDANTIAPPRPKAPRAPGKIRIPLAEAAAFADVAPLFSYAASQSPVAMQIGALLLKLVLVAATGGNLRRSALPSSTLFFTLFAMLIFVSTALSPYADIAGTFPPLVALANVGLTLALLRPASMERYTLSVATMTALVNVVYLAFAATGRIDNWYGRLFYLGNTQPNLGAEIAAAGCIAACATLSAKNSRIAWSLVPNIITAVVTQGRAALLAIAIAVAIRVFIVVRQRFSRSLGPLIVFTVVGLPLLIALTANAFVERASDVLMVNDEYRGVGTGFAGRSDRWANAFKIFGESPITGGGPGAFEATGLDSPHNFYLYALSEFGLTSLIIFALLFSHTRRAIRLNPYHAIAMIPLLALTFFNDRFLNLNIYPSLMYVMLLGYSAWRIRPITTR